MTSFLFLVCLAAGQVSQHGGQVERPEMENLGGVMVAGGPEATSAEAKAASWQKHLAMVASSPFQDLTWRVIGPRFQGSRVSCFSSVPGKPYVQYLGVGLGGLWKTVNNGTTWTPVFEGHETQSIGDVVVAPSNPNVVWLGTGEGLMSGNSTPGAGVYRSTDAGKTWKSVGLKDTHHISKLIVDPKNADVCYVAAVGHNFSNNEERGVFKTTDGGKTWTHSLFIDDKTGVTDLIVDPSNSKVLYASGWQRDRGSSKGLRGKGGGIFKSTDAGKSWKKLGGGFPDNDHVGRVGIDISRTNPKVLYALLDSDSDDAGLFKSTDAGATWTVVNKKDVKGAWDMCAVRVSPDNENEVYVPGQKTFVSEDGGATFKQVAGTVVHLLPRGSEVLHLDARNMWIDPKNADHIVLMNDGGLHISYDRGKTWMLFNNIPAGECYAVSYDDQTPYNIYAGTQDDSAVFGPSTFMARDGIEDSWKHVFLDIWGGGDAFFTYRDPSDPESVYYEQQMGDVHRKNMVTGKTKGIQPRAAKGEPDLRFNWMAPYFVSKHDTKTLYLAANKVMKSTDRGDHWTAVSGDLTGDPKHPDQPAKGTISALSESPMRAGLLYAGTDRGTVSVTKDDGKTWTDVTGAFPNCIVSRVLASAFDPGTVYVSLSGFRSDDTTPYLFRSRDYGATWEPITGDLPSESVYVVIEDPRDKDVLYVGTDLGVYVSLDGGGSWKSLCHGLPALRVFDLFVHPKTFELVAGTHGRGVFLMDVKSIKGAQK